MISSTMQHNTFKRISVAVATITIISVFALWSINTLSDLYGGPQAQFKHAFAFIGILLLAKWSPTGLHTARSRIHGDHRVGRRGESDRYGH